MNGHFETSGIYPLSVVPAEGYGTDPKTRSGKQILGHVNGKYLQVNDSPEGFTLVEGVTGATKFDDINTASTEAAKLISKARENHAAKQAA